MPMKNNPSESQRGFDAVAESRRWKQAVAAATADMSKRMAWFRQSSVPAIREQAQSTPGAPVLRDWSSSDKTSSAGDA